MDPVSEVFPLWVIALDYASGVVMWTLIGRTAMGFFLPEDSSFFFMRFFVRSTNPLLRFFAPVTLRIFLYLFFANDTVREQEYVLILNDPFRYLSQLI